MAIERIGGIPPAQPPGYSPEEIVAAKKLRAPLGQLIQALQNLTPDKARDDAYLSGVRDQLLSLQEAAKKATEL